MEGNKFRIGNKDSSLDWNVVANLLRIFNATIEIKNAQGDVIANIDGDTGATMFGKGNILLNADGSASFGAGKNVLNDDGSGSLADGNLLWDAIGNLLISGKFESNKNGNRIVIDPITRSLKMLNSDNEEILSLGFVSSGGSIYSFLELTGRFNNAKRITRISQGQITLYTEGRSFDPEFIVYIRSDGKVSMQFNSDSLPTARDGAGGTLPWGLYRDGETVKIRTS